MHACARTGLAALLLASLADPAHGFGGRWGYTASYSYPVNYATYYPTAYSLPAVAYYAPAWQGYAAPVVCAPTVTVSVPAGPWYAVPTAAPPSQTVEPPPVPNGTRTVPKVAESRSGTALKTVQAGGAVTGRVQVGFWNVSGRDLTLTIDGRPHVLPRNRSLTLDLGRQFVWRIDERAPQNENIPEGNSTLEIVLRR